MEELWTVALLVDGIGKLVDEIQKAVGVVYFVEKLPHLLSQQNTLIS